MTKTTTTTTTKRGGLLSARKSCKYLYARSSRQKDGGDEYVKIRREGGGQLMAIRMVQVGVEPRCVK